MFGLWTSLLGIMGCACLLAPPNEFVERFLFWWICIPIRGPFTQSNHQNWMFILFVEIIIAFRGVTFHIAELFLQISELCEQNFKMFSLMASSGAQLVDGLFRIFFSNTTKWHVFRKVLTYRNRISIQKNPSLALLISDFFKKLKIY